jgi:spermidine synthase
VLALLGLFVALSIAASLQNKRPDRGTRHVVHQERSLYRNILVTEHNGLRCMIFGLQDGRQGCISLHDPDALVLPYSRALLASLLVQPRPQRALVIGLGVGILPRILQAYDPTLAVDAVELDPAVVKVAREHFGFSCSGRCTVHTDDGRVFVRHQRRAGRRYDLIVVDAFDVRYIPEHLLTREFMLELRAILAPGGVIAANTFSNGALQPYEVATYQSVFGPTLAVETGVGNRIILAATTPPTLPAMQANAGVVDQRLARYDVSAQWLMQRTGVQPPVPGHAPLTDQYSPSNLLLAD